MEKNNLKRLHPNKKTKQIGRGGTRGKTSGRGTKGQNARAGHKKRPEIRDFIKRIPKLRGRGKNINTSIKVKPFVINLEKINKLFKNGDIVSPVSIMKKGILNVSLKNLPKVKILGKGEIKISVKIEKCDVSNTAKLAIEKAGGSILV